MAHPASSCDSSHAVAMATPSAQLAARSTSSTGSCSSKRRRTAAAASPAAPPTPFRHSPPLASRSAAVPDCEAPIEFQASAHAPLAGARLQLPGRRAADPSGARPRAAPHPAAAHAVLTQRLADGDATARDALAHCMLAHGFCVLSLPGGSLKLNIT